jgi:hypothetical protein
VSSGHHEAAHALQAFGEFAVRAFSFAVTQAVCAHRGCPSGKLTICLEQRSRWRRTRGVSFQICLRMICA